ncbi:MAG: hypothetical protein M1482_12230 [Chloroflexi bacterium]|nr:hypothetical protein [Chloroflexota bacterium]
MIRQFVVVQPAESTTKEGNRQYGCGKGKTTSSADCADSAETEKAKPLYPQIAQIPQKRQRQNHFIRRLRRFRRNGKGKATLSADCADSAETAKAKPLYPQIAQIPETSALLCCQNLIRSWVFKLVIGSSAIINIGFEHVSIILADLTNYRVRRPN